MFGGHTVSLKNNALKLCVALAVLQVDAAPFPRVIPLFGELRGPLDNTPDPSDVVVSPTHESSANSDVAPLEEVSPQKVWRPVLDVRHLQSDGVSRPQHRTELPGRTPSLSRYPASLRPATW